MGRGSRGDAVDLAVGGRHCDRRRSLARRAADRRLGGTALAIQGLHVLEHVVLTGSLVATGSAFGLSTRLDEVLPWGASTVRVLFHFGVNAVATTHTIAAVREAVRAAGWRRWPAAFRPMATPSGAGRALR